MMRISFSPQSSRDMLVLSKAGDMLTINGDTIDLSSIPEGATVRNASMLHPMLCGDIERSEGRLAVVVALPYYGRSGYVPAPPPIIDPPDGPIEVPVIAPDAVGEPQEDAE